MPSPSPVDRNLWQSASRLASASNDELKVIVKHDPDMIRDVGHALETFYADASDTFAGGGYFEKPRQPKTT